jgi:hypothetical protein
MRFGSSHPPTPTLPGGSRTPNGHGAEFERQLNITASLAIPVTQTRQRLDNRVTPISHSDLVSSRAQIASDILPVSKALK